MVQEKYAVRLSWEDQEQLRGLIYSGRHSARVINRARILLKTGRRVECPPGGGGSGHVAAHGVPHQTAVRRSGVGGRAARPSPSQPVSQARRSG